MLGTNGCGKSTLLRTLAGLQPPLLGDIMLKIPAGMDVPPATNDLPLSRFSHEQLARTIALVLTERESIDKTLVHDIVAMGRYPYTNLRGTLTPHDEQVIDTALQDVGLTHLAGRWFTSLSDGEKQRVLIAKALAQQTPVILLDEPTAHLDLPNRIKTMLLLRRLAHEQHKAILISTHELDLALQTADLIWLMTAQSGVRVGTPADLTSDGSFQRAFADSAFRFADHNGHLSIIVEE